MCAGNLSPDYQLPVSPVFNWGVEDFQIPYKPEHLTVVSSIVAVGTTVGGNSIRRKMNEATSNCYCNLVRNTFAETRSSPVIRPMRYEAQLEHLAKFEDWLNRHTNATLKRLRK